MSGTSDRAAVKLTAQELRRVQARLAPSTAPQLALSLTGVAERVIDVAGGIVM